MKSIYFITDFTDQLFVRAFKQQMLEENDIIEINNLESLLNKLNAVGDSFAYVKINESDEVIGFILGQKIVLSNAFFQEFYGYIKIVWKSERFDDKSCYDELLQLCEKRFEKMGITQFAVDCEIAKESVFLRNQYFKNECLLHNGKQVFCKK